ncbi:MAG: ATP-binding protein [Pseudohongiellaceae bacterium]
MITRTQLDIVLKNLAHFPAVALLGPRQVGKTTLALDIADSRDSVYLDLENPTDLNKLSDIGQYLADHEDKLVILDEVHRAPKLFAALRGLIDKGRRRGLKVGRFLLLGSASLDLLRQTGESLAGRIAYIELTPLGILEVGSTAQEKLWLRGGYPESFLAKTNQASMAWRNNFVKTYLERDIPALGPRIPAETLRRLWTMLAHSQGGLVNVAQLAGNLSLSGKTISRYLDLMVDLLLVRRLQPCHANVRKRLVKSPKIYVRDSGVVHTLLDIPDRDSLLGHPICGASWEGFVIDNLLAAAPDGTLPSYYRTAVGAEVDLVLDLPGLSQRWAIEIKSGSAPKPSKGLFSAIDDVTPDKVYVVNAGKDKYPLTTGVEAISLTELMKMLSKWKA